MNFKTIYMKALLCSAILAGLLLNAFQLHANNPLNEIRLKLNEPSYTVKETLLSFTGDAVASDEGSVFITMNYYHEGGQRFFKMHFRPEQKDPDRNRILMFDKQGESDKVFQQMSGSAQQDFVKGRDFPDNVFAFYQTSPKVLELQTAFPLGFVDFVQATTGELIFDIDFDNLPENNKFELRLQFYHGSFPRRRDYIEVHSRFLHFGYKIELVPGQIEATAAEEPPDLQTVDPRVLTVDCQKWYAELHNDIERLNSKFYERNFSSRLIDIEIILTEVVGNNTERYKDELDGMRNDLNGHRDDLKVFESLVSEKSTECKEEVDSLMYELSQAGYFLNNLTRKVYRLLDLIREIDSKVAELDQEPGIPLTEQDHPVEESQQFFLRINDQANTIYSRVNSIRLGEQRIDGELQQELRSDMERLEALKRDFEGAYNGLSADLQELFSTSYQIFNNYYIKTLAIYSNIKDETVHEGSIREEGQVQETKETRNTFEVLAYILIIIVVLLLGFIIFVRLRAKRIMNKQIKQSRPPAVNKLMSKSRRVKGAVSKAKRLKIK